METESISLGQGFLTWGGEERVTDRYGSVWLAKMPGPGPAKSVEELLGNLTRHELDDAGNAVNKKALRRYAGTKGKLIAVVIEPRESGHIGDLFRGFFPSLPDEGETVMLGEGTLLIGMECEVEGKDCAVVVEPDDGRDSDWLDPRGLYRCHSSRVELFWKPR